MNRSWVVSLGIHCSHGAAILSTRLDVVAFMAYPAKVAEIVSATFEQWDDMIHLGSLTGAVPSMHLTDTMAPSKGGSLESLYRRIILITTLGRP